MQTHFEVAVVGGGIMGLSAAWQLCRRGVGVVLVDRYRVGHVRGSSHGESRVARAAYADPLWASLARESLTRSWPELERAAGSTLLHRQPVYLFGPSQGAIGQYAEAVESIEGIASIAAERAREHAAALRIADEDLVLEDRTGGVIHAEATMAALRAALLGDGATIKEGLALLTLRPAAMGTKLLGLWATTAPFSCMW